MRYLNKKVEKNLLNCKKENCNKTLMENQEHRIPPHENKIIITAILTF